MASIKSGAITPSVYNFWRYVAPLLLPCNLLFLLSPPSRLPSFSFFFFSCFFYSLHFSEARTLSCGRHASFQNVWRFSVPRTVRVGGWYVEGEGVKEVSGVCDEDVTALFARRSPEAYDDLGVWTLPEYFLPHRERCGTVKPLTHGLSPSAAATTAAMDALCSPSDVGNCRTHQRHARPSLPSPSRSILYMRVCSNVFGYVEECRLKKINK